jgi:hypothetical protein
MYSAYSFSYLGALVLAELPQWAYYEKLSLSSGYLNNSFTNFSNRLGTILEMRGCGCNRF